MCFVTFITLVVDVFITFITWLQMCFNTLVVDVLCYIHYGGCRCVLLHSLRWLQMCFVTFITVIVDVFCYIHYIFVDVLCYIHYIGCRCVFYIHYIFVDVLCYIHYIGCRCVMLHSLHWLQMCFVTFITSLQMCYVTFITLVVDVFCYIHYIACRWHPRVLWRGLGSHIHHTTLQSLASKYTIMIYNVISTSNSVVVYIKTVLEEFIR